MPVLPSGLGRMARYSAWTKTWIIHHYQRSVTSKARNSNTLAYNAAVYFIVLYLLVFMQPWAKHYVHHLHSASLPFLSLIIQTKHTLLTMD